MIVDTNVLVSMALGGSGRLAPIWRGWREGRFDVLSCPRLLEEVRAVLGRPKLATLVDSPTRDALLRDLAALTVSVELAEPWPEFQDPKDRFLLALARDGNADVLVTGDLALQGLVQFSETVILSPADFVQALQSR